MQLSRHGTRELVLIFIVCTALTALAVRYFLYAVPVPIGFFLLSVYFFRDPERDVPGDEQVLVSPADGQVADIEEVEEDMFLEEPCLRIGIFLSVFDVHVNRCPAAGTVEQFSYREGAFHNAMSPEASLENESHLVGFQGPQGGFAVKQIAGLIARRIVCSLGENDEVKRGERMGMIKFGSRTELYVPLSGNPSASVDVGDRVYGGESILVQLREDAE